MGSALGKNFHFLGGVLINEWVGSTKKGGRITGAGGFNPGASMAGTSFGGTMGLSGAVPMNFRGQDKSLNPTLGTNPNVQIEDEYIQNLQ